ncbi:hypothetical protein [Alkalibacillus salilacus]|nr:hypothetical protein [Alkalibacillus salilacus]
MTVLLIIVGLLILICCFMILTKLTFHLTITYAHKQQDIFMKMTWMNQAIFKRTIPLIQLDDHLSLNIEEKDQMWHQPTKEKKKHYSTDDVKEQVSLVNRVVDITQDVFPRIRRLLKDMTLHHFSWSSEIGMKAADHTAVLVSITNVLKSVGCRTLAQLLQSQEHLEYHVTPNYQRALFKTHFECIISIRISHIIRNAFSIVWQYYKLKRWNSNERTSYS